MFKSLFSKALMVLPFITTSVFAEPIVWQIKDANREFIILGSVHAGTSDMYPLPSAFLEHWKTADSLVVEANILRPPQTPLDMSGPTTSSMLNHQQLQKLASIANDLKLSYSSLSKNPPWLTVISIQMSLATQLGLSAEQGIDTILLRRAMNDDLPILELESVEQQLSMLKGMPNHGKEMLTTSIDDWEKMSSEFTCLINAWKAGDSQKLTALFEESQHSEAVDNVLIFDRNKDWANQLTNGSPYQQGKFMIVVGAFHLFGDKGLPNLLKQNGFTVTQLTKSKKVQC
ncbi:TraB/GumN family protein [Photobacterium indicum]|uniref:TraB/GumN family protein n=1 Tax=Photobacterium indicum TaxID=81447 RepID=UPI003D09B22B